MKIVSLLPSATEIVYALGLGDQLVGVTHECDFPAAARSKPKLTASALPAALQTHPGSQSSAANDPSAKIDRHVRANVHAGSSLYFLDDELLARLAPNLIITQELCQVCAVSYHTVARAAKRLATDPRIVSLEPASLADVYANISTVGDFTASSTNAQAVIGALREREHTLAREVLGRARPRTLLLEWTDPPMSGGHWVPELVERAGGEPLLGNAGENSITVTWDAITAADPDVIIAAPCGFDLNLSLEALDALSDGPQWRALRAVRTGRVFAVDGNAYVNRPGPRLLDTAEIFASVIHNTPYGAGKSDPLSWRTYDARSPTHAQTRDR